MALSGDHLRWYAVRVRTLHESPTAALLNAKGYAPFLPTYTCRRQWSDRIKVVQEPLFPGYLFCQFNVHNRLPILVTPGVIGIVGFGKSPVPVADDEMQALQLLVRSGIPSQPWAFLNIGDRVRVNHGSLYGVEGVLVQFRSRHRIILNVSLLQRAVAVEIDSALVSLVYRAAVSTTLACPVEFATH